MKNILALFAAVTIGLAGGRSAAAAADPLRQQQVTLVTNQRQHLTGKIKGREMVEYTVTVPAQTRLVATFKSKNRSAYFNVNAEGATEALFVGSRDGAKFAAQAGAAYTTYTINVYLMRNAARRNETANYILDLSR